MGELIRKTMKKHGIRCKNAALVLNNETVFIRNVLMPIMNVDQLEYNLPFEFRDYISDELSNYVYDYEVLSTNAVMPAEDETDEAPAQAMELMAVAAPKSLMEEAKAILRKASLKLAAAAPAVCAFQNLIREDQKKGESPEKEYCMLDLGYRTIRMHIFRGDKHVVTRGLELGLSSIDTVIAEAYKIDEHLAHTYLLTNYEGCLGKDYCINAYNTIAVELMRAINFYQFSNPDSHLEDVYVCGGGAAIAPLEKTIEETLDLKVHPVSELLPRGSKTDDAHSTIQAIGIAFN